MNLLNKNIWEPIIGLWSIIHGLFGGIVALVCILYNLSFVSGLLAVSVLAILWELLEVFFDGHENYINRAVDVLIAVFVYLTVYYFYVNHNFPIKTIRLSLWIFSVIFIIGSIIGWIAYLKYNKL